MSAVLRAARIGAMVLLPFAIGVYIGWWVPSTTDSVSSVAAGNFTVPQLPAPIAQVLTPADTATSTPTPTPTTTPTPPDTETPTPTGTPTPSATSTVTNTTTPTPTVEVRLSFIEDATMLTIYGRAFGVAPILGMLGGYKGFPDMERDVVKRFYPEIKANNGGKPIIPAVHLIYALAIPCSPGDDCLLYLEQAKIDVIKEYIEPAAKAGWHVILDSQLGRSDPVAQVKRMIDRGYLKYENVHLALDPEFHSYPGRNTPGIPVGIVEAVQLNEAQQLLDDYLRTQGLKRKKLFMVHQFGDAEVNDGVPFMINNKKALKTFPTLDLVLDADGFGGPEAKVAKYNLMFDPDAYPFVTLRAIKLFLPNREAPNHYDKPLLSWPATFGKADTPDGRRMRWPPNVVILA